MQAIAEIIKKQIKAKKDNLDKIQETLVIISIIRKLERVGDHITNIAEEVIFYKEAKVLRHVDKSGDKQKEIEDGRLKSILMSGHFLQKGHNCQLQYRW